MPRDRDSSFEPKIVAKRQKRLSGVDELEFSLSAKGQTLVRCKRIWPRSTAPRRSRQTISTLNDKVLARDVPRSQGRTCVLCPT